jgi:hypothetical protein
MSLILNGTSGLFGNVTGGDISGNFIGLNGNGSSLTATATGSTTARSLANRFADVVNVKDFGAVGDGVTDDTIAIQAAITAIPITGGTILFPTGTYYISTNPTFGTTAAKSILYDISSGANFIGPAGAGGTTSNAGKFPSCLTNGEIIPVGLFAQSRSSTRTRAGDASSGLAIEVFDGSISDQIGRIGIFSGAKLKGSDPLYSISSAANFVAQADAGSSGNIWGLEINLGVNTPNGTQFGISINGSGTETATFGIKLDNSATNTVFYKTGIALRQCVVGLSVETTNGLENAAVFGTPPIRYSDNLIQATQLQNSGSVLLLQRNTNTSPSGFFINAINSNNTSQLFSVGINGEILGRNLTMSGPAQATSIGSVNISGQTATTATAGSLTLPAAPSGFIVGFSGTTQIKIPYYNA